MLDPWNRLGMQICALGFEASFVMMLRLQKIAWGGPAAKAEMHRMVQEKVVAASSVQSMAVRDGGRPLEKTAAKAIRHY